MPIVKICGLNDAVSVAAVAKAGADMAGFMFFAASPRHLTYDQAANLASHVSPGVAKVAVTVDASDDELAIIKDVLGPDLIQLHGSETVERAGQIAKQFGVKIIKALALATPEDLELARVYDGQVDWLLFDAKPPKSGRPGGWGTAFDWRLMAGTTWASSWMLAGGLTPDNVVAALGITGAPGVDVSSGVERELGRKSPQLIEEFVRKARSGG